VDGITPKVFIDALFRHVDSLLLIQRNEHEAGVFNKYLFRLKLAYLNGGLLAESRQGSGNPVTGQLDEVFP
jgi:hypothetical protein